MEELEEAADLNYNDKIILVMMVDYISSYVCRFYENIFNISGTAQLAQKYGEWFTWDGSPRAKIFARNHTSVTNITTMMKLMRYYHTLYITLYSLNS